MATERIISVRCSRCGAEHQAVGYDRIDREMAQQVKSGQLFQDVCPRCQFISTLEFNTIYEDGNRIVYVLHKETPNYDQVVAGLMNGKAGRELYIVEDMHGLSEQLAAFDQMDSGSACPNCGSAMVEDTCAQCGYNVPVPVPVKKKKGGKAAAIILAILLLLSLGFNVLQYILSSTDYDRLESELSLAEDENAELTQELEDYRNTLGDKSLTIDAYEDQLADKDDELDTLQSQLDYYKDNYNDAQDELDMLQAYRDFYEELVSSDFLADAKSNFFTNQNIIVMQDGGRSKTITLTANWQQGGQVNANFDPSVARVIFDQDNWNTSTTLTLQPTGRGMCVVTLTNNVDSSVIKLLVIVTA